MTKLKSYEELKAIWDNFKKSNSQGKDIRILVGMATCGIAAGSQKVFDAMEKEIKNLGLKNVIISKTGCLGLCYTEPNVEVIFPEEESTIYGNLNQENAVEIIRSHVNNKKVVQNLVVDKAGKNKQTRIALRNCGVINPEKIEHYIGRGGYDSLAKILEKSTDEVIDVIKKSGLRGRGGGGFPIGVKLEAAKKQTSDIKYIICNADEGDPGAFMDRSILESDPHSVLEGMAIAGYVIGSNKGFIYIRAEYPLAVERLKIALNQAREYGLLGKAILNKNFDFDIEIRYGAGAFVCGEETALIKSIEGSRGEPTNKPPFPAEKGLWQKPTTVNNVETFANLPEIFLKGHEWFSSIGTEKSKGTKVFALAGKVNNVGLAEVPMGTTLRDIIFGIGGGIKNGKRFKSVQTGGPSGGCIPEKNIDTPIDYDSLLQIGSMMGSGGMIVLDEDDCMVNIAKFYLEFTMDESCGKCTACRIGNKRLHEILSRIVSGNGKQKDLDDLKELSEIIKDTALCGLGQSSPNPVLSTMKHFWDEYQAHVNEKRCPSGVCTALLKYNISTDKCMGCTVCQKVCPVSCISGERKKAHIIDQEKCIKCGACQNACKFNAILKV